ncbi:MAG: hypothetical protein CVU71_02960 [Deltaproteobacteria bacterium HGW-Deltaproteobacteria-6]|jgi:hypothetical protein|nr:MAG: hypothetical protein CVU71_02960 [Deltaproteobacteria bacterium HGW-Deltaproteobacteria-6]
MQKVLICFISFFVVFNLEIFHPSLLSGSDYNINQHRTSGTVIPPSVSKEESRPVLTVTPREIDLGSVKPGETVFGEFNLKNISPGTMSWSTSCPEGWDGVTGKTLRGSVSGEPANLSLELKIAERAENIPGDKKRIPGYQTSMKLEAAGRELICNKDLKAGEYRKAIKITSAGGQRTIFVDFRIHALQEIPSISLNPQRLDLGTQLPGKIISKRIELINKGREMLRWSVAQPQANVAQIPGELQKERYLSFHNEVLPEPGKYIIPEHLKDSMELIGKWTEKNGYPLSKGAASSIKYRFNGTGISVFLQSHTEDGNCSIYLDEILLNLPDVLSGQWEKKELVIAEGLAEGPHVVTIVIREGSLELEGIKVFGKDIMRGPRGWITVFPNSGTTMTEIDYINVKVDTSNLTPGYYGDKIIFKSNAGEEKAEIYVDIMSDSGPKIIDVYLYSKDKDYLFTIDPQAESKRLIQNGYLKEGIAFRLFMPQTPGTTNFYRWYNPVKRDHYYHYDRSGGGKKLDGYVYEGTIGNIATSRMTNTRELYRWFNPSTGRHYYSTNAKAATGERKGYRFDGIAGYVR